MKTTGLPFDEQQAIAELLDLSQNARLFLQDRIGNSLTAVRLDIYLKRHELADQAIQQLIGELQDIGLFKTWKGN